MTFSVSLRTEPGATMAIPFQGEIFYAEAPGTTLSGDDLRFLSERFVEQMDVLLPFILRHHSHIFVPLSEPEEGYHVSFSGRFSLDDLQPFFRQAPNALTVVDGRAWGFFRIRLMAVTDDLTFERVAEIEVHTAQESDEAGFELFWAEAETHRPTHIRLYDRRPVEGAQAVEGLVSRWANRIKQTQILTAADKAELLAAHKRDLTPART